MHCWLPYALLGQGAQAPGSVQNVVSHPCPWAQGSRELNRSGMEGVLGLCGPRLLLGLWVATTELSCVQ